jgi:hypothetical protein
MEGLDRAGVSMCTATEPGKAAAAEKASQGFLSFFFFYTLPALFELDSS